jgi:hypothetical protein
MEDKSVPFLLDIHPPGKTPLLDYNSLLTPARGPLLAEFPGFLPENPGFRSAEISIIPSYHQFMNNIHVLTVPPNLSVQAGYNDAAEQYSKKVFDSYYGYKSMGDVLASNLNAAWNLRNPYFHMQAKFTIDRSPAHEQAYEKWKEEDHALAGYPPFHTAVTELENFVNEVRNDPVLRRFNQARGGWDSFRPTAPKT